MDKAQQQAFLAMIPSLPRLYANGFSILQTSSDLSLVLQANNAGVAVVSMSIIAAKTLARDLSKAVKAFEDATKQTIPFVDELNELLMKSEQSNV
jgi:hypothetical protein